MLNAAISPWVAPLLAQGQHGDLNRLYRNTGDGHFEPREIVRPGGRVVVSDIVLDGELPEAVRSSLLAYVGCIAGALQRDDYLAAVRDASLKDVEILKDVDYLAAVGFKASIHGRDVDGVQSVDPAELAGKVRSITLRAVKPV